MKGFFLALDLCHRDTFLNRFEWANERNRVEGLAFGPTYEHFYWHGEQRTWYGAVEDATEYATREEAEAQSVFAMALDADVAGHMHIVSALEAFRREKDKIEARNKAKLEREIHDKNRFRLGPGEGGLI